MSSRIRISTRDVARLDERRGAIVAALRLAGLAIGFGVALSLGLG